MMRIFLLLIVLVLGLLAGTPEGVAQQGAASSAAPFPVPATPVENGDEGQKLYVLRSDGSPDYTAWGKLADRVEQALQVGRASDGVMRDLRAELVDWRGLFSTAKSENDIRINTLKTQIATLGPKPEGEGTEPAILTQRREELSQELSAAQAPVQAAEEARSRANVLIGEIDSLLRARQADQLLRLGPTPVNPVLWPAAVEDLGASLHLVASEVKSNFGSDAQRADLLEDLPLTVMLLVIGAVLLLRGRIWVMRMGDALRARRRGSSRGVVGFVVSIGQVLAPLLGMVLLVEALNLVGILGLRGQVLADTLPSVAVLVFGSLWLGNRVFGVEGADWPVLEMPSTVARAEARFDVALLGALLALKLVLQTLADHEGYSEATYAVLIFPIYLGLGVLLVRLGRLLRLHAKLRARDEESASFRSSVLGLVSTITTLVGFSGPTVAAIGYQSLADEVLIPWVLTLGLLALLEVLHRFVVSLYGVILRKDEEEAGQALWPVLISFAVVIATLPLLALIWGARVTDLTELWTVVMNGIQLGDARLTPRSFLIFAAVFLVGYMLTRLLQSMLKSSVLPKTKLDIGGQNAISAGVGYLGIFLAALIAITSAGLDLSSVAIVAGALSVGIGFGLQNIVSNFISGIILLVERPISEGDWIEVGGQMGYVRDISVRSTRIETFDRSDVILPNSDLISGVVTNYTRGNAIGRIILPVGVGYGTDTKRVEQVLREIAEAHPMVTVNPPPSVLFTNFGADALEFEVRAILSDVNFSLSVKSELNHEIARRFAEEGFEIPFAQRDLWIRNPEALRPAPLRKETMPAPVRPVPDEFTIDDMQDGASEGVEGEGDE
ncbi:DUF3772 domain-containing protein [Aliiroseovarius crassostreae]|uniref:DUF3772 domain-containing protein n=1 Tax=Aliiroseovarius crassostreae TaxID=154981 RepID=UPI002208991B|nr:DUF3772 domain-containing protein [Aliiroseovarius crassostreae]UWQ09887.1 DUF3772 domain-containing protein [Aliiroseovarius crassostreae]